LKSSRTRMMGKSAILFESGKKGRFTILHGIIRTKNFDIAGKLGLNHLLKFIINLWKFRQIL
jgi:hypothetical protein